MRYRYSFILLLFLNLLYAVLVVEVVFKHQHVNDFMSLYWSTKAYLAHQFPYQEFHPTWGEQALTLPYNLNPPVVFLIFAPLACLPYMVSAILWLVGSILMGLASFYLSLSLLFVSSTWKPYWPMLAVSYCMFGGALANEWFLQLGSFIALLVIGGYALLLRQRECAAGFVWSIAAAIKLFPALLVVYLLSQKKWKGSATLLFTFLIFITLPLCYDTISLYRDYLHLFRSVGWYGDNWNVSLYGYLHRIFSGQHVVSRLFGMLSALSLAWYLKQLWCERRAHDGFCLTLLMMLFLSPFGWYYYGTLLIFPFLMLSKRSSAMLGLLAFFLLNLPMNYMSWHDMTSQFDKVVWHSMYFYGLLILIYVMSQDQKDIVSDNEMMIRRFKAPVLSILIVCFLMRFVIYGLISMRAC